MKVNLSTFHITENKYYKNGKYYKVTDLITLAKSAQEIIIPLAGIDISNKPWGLSSMKSFIGHYKRTEEADMQYPIILDDEGFICDGWHRVAKAILQGDIEIKARRLEIMPEPTTEE